MKIAAYCRVSTEKEDQLNSLETQKTFFSEYARKNGHELIGLYADEGISGTKTKNRKAFLRLMEDARTHCFDMLVVKDISRFARNTVDLLQNVRTLKSLGIETLFLTANMTVLGQSEFVLTVFGALAQEESANISKRVKFGKRENAKRGRVPNFVYGYDKTKGDYFHLTINEREAAIVRQIFNWYVREGYGAAKIASMLNERGERTKRGCGFSQNAVCRILTNEIYIGKIINGKEEVADFLTGVRTAKDSDDWLVAERPELRIVSDEEFEQAGTIMETRKRAANVTGCGSRGGRSSRYLFSTLIRCRDCGWSYRRMVRKYKNTYIKWVCSGHNGRGADSCPNAVVLDESELVQTIDEFVQELIGDEKNLEKKIKRSFIKTMQLRGGDEMYRAELEAKWQKNKHARKKYMEMYAEGLIEREEMKEELLDLKKKAEAIEGELNVVKERLKGDGAEAVFRKFFDNAMGLSSVGDMPNAMLKRMIDRIEVDHEGNIDIYFRKIPECGESE